LDSSRRNILAIQLLQKYSIMELYIVIATLKVCVVMLCCDVVVFLTCDRFPYDANNNINKNNNTILQLHQHRQQTTAAAMTITLTLTITITITNKRNNNNTNTDNNTISITSAASTSKLALSCAIINYDFRCTKQRGCVRSNNQDTSAKILIHYASRIVVLWYYSCHCVTQ